MPHNSPVPNAVPDVYIHPEDLPDPKQEPMKHQVWRDHETRKFYFRRADIFWGRCPTEYWIWFLTPEMAEAIAIFWDSTDRYIFERSEDFLQYLAKKYPEYMIEGYNDNKYNPKKPKWERLVYDEQWIWDRLYFKKQDFYVHDRFPRWPVYWFWLFWPLKDESPKWFIQQYDKIIQGLKAMIPPEPVVLALPKPELKYRMFVQRYTKTKYK